MNAAALLLTALRARGLAVTVRPEGLWVAPRHLLTAADRQDITQHKDAMAALLRAEQPGQALTPDDVAMAAHLLADDLLPAAEWLERWRQLAETASRWNEGAWTTWEHYGRRRAMKSIAQGSRM